MRKLIASTLIGAASFAATSSAYAGDFTPWFEASRAGGFVDLWPSKSTFNDSNNVVAIFGADLSFRVARKVFLDMSFTGAYVDFDDRIFGIGNRFQQAAYGNPTIGAHYATEVTSRFDFYIGGSLTVPLLLDPDGDVAAAAYYAAPIRGYWDIDRFTLGHVAVRAAAGIELEMVRHFYLRADLRPVVHILANDRFRGRGVGPGFTRNGDADFFLEHDVEIEYRLDGGFGFGARLQGVGTFTENDAYQLMFEPFIGLTPKHRGFFFRLGFPLALDESLGFGLDRGKVATGRLSLGGQW